MSFRKASISASVGGRPVRSNVTRRMRVARSAGGDGERPAASSLSITKRSMGVAAHALRFASRLRGGSDFVRGSNAQCSPQFAPWATHLLSVSICAAESLRFRLGGGITSSASWLVTRRRSSPDLTTSSAAAFSSRRSFALRDFASGPWQWKHMSDRIGSTSRPKSMSAARAGDARTSSRREARSMGWAWETRGRMFRSSRGRVSVAAGLSLRGESVARSAATRHAGTRRRREDNRRRLPTNRGVPRRYPRVSALRFSPRSPHAGSSLRLPGTWRRVTSPTSSPRG